MANSKPAFLLSKATEVMTSHIKTYYDSDNNLNMLTDEDGTTVAASSLNHLITQSKTFAAPADDDPDTEAEFCY